MAPTGSVRVLFTSSVAATMPGSYQTVYHASKSFIQSFAEALRDELRDTDVSVSRGNSTNASGFPSCAVQ